MGQTKIEWTATYLPDGTALPGYTFNPWTGCLKVSPGCQHCYAESLDKRWGHDRWGPGSKRERTSPANWRKPSQWNRQAKAMGIRRKVFCASMADVFEDNPQVSDWRSDLWDLIELTPNLDWLLLTKRPENVLRFTRRWSPENYGPVWPENVWIGTSVENQEWADKRIPELLKIPARVRFLSIEPLLGEIRLYSYLANNSLYKAEYWGAGKPVKGQQNEDGTITAWDRCGQKFEDGSDIHWVIVGGESGPKARPCHPLWVMSLRDQCQKCDVAFFFKQWGQFAPVLPGELDDYGKWQGEGPEPHIESVWGTDECGYYCDEAVGHVDHRQWFMKRVGKVAAGRLLDGREYNEMPEVKDETHEAVS